MADELDIRTMDFSGVEATPLAGDRPLHEPVRHLRQEPDPTSPHYLDETALAAKARERDFIDYPTGWVIQAGGLTHTDARCSAWQTGGAMLCDCDALEQRWRELRDMADPLEAIIDAAVSAAEDSYDHGPHYECCYGRAAFAIAVEAGVRAVLAPAVTRDALAAVLRDHEVRLLAAAMDERFDPDDTCGAQAHGEHCGGCRTCAELANAKAVNDLWPAFQSAADGLLAKYDIHLRPTEGSDTNHG